MGFAEQCAENAHKKCQLLRGFYRTKALYFVYIHANRRGPKRTPRTPLADAELHVGGPENTRTKRAQNAHKIRKFLPSNRGVRALFGPKPRMKRIPNRYFYCIEPENGYRSAHGRTQILQ